MRTCERLIPNTKSFESYKFKDLKAGDLFRLYEDFDPVINYNGHTVWKALSDAYQNDKENWQVDIVDSVIDSISEK